MTSDHPIIGLRGYGTTLGPTPREAALEFPGNDVTYSGGVIDSSMSQDEPDWSSNNVPWRIEVRNSPVDVDPLLRADPPTTTNKQAYEESEDFVDDPLNLGLLIPVVLLCLFLMVVGACVLWHTWHDKRRARQLADPVGTFYRHGTVVGPDESSAGGIMGLIDEWRASTRSTTPLRRQSKEFVPKLDRISESPEDHLTPRVGRSFQDDSLNSVFSSIRFDLPSLSSKTPQYPATHYITDVSQSFPNLVLSPQAPFSPYHLTWITPYPGRPVQSDTDLITACQSQNADQLDQLYDSRASSMSGNMPLNSFNQSWKSPYHPNYNTPTNGSEENSTVPSVLLNRTRSMSDSTAPVDVTPASSNVDGPRERRRTEDTPEPEKCPPLDESLAVSPPVDLGSLPPPPPYDSSTSRSAPILALSAQNLSLPSHLNLSCPGNLDDVWNFNHMYLANMQPSHVLPLLDSCTSFTQSDQSGLELASAGTSMCPIVGSNETSMVFPQHASLLNPPPPFSNDTSTCAQIDSCETSLNSGGPPGIGHLMHPVTSGFAGPGLGPLPHGLPGMHAGSRMMNPGDPISTANHSSISAQLDVHSVSAISGHQAGKSHSTSIHHLSRDRSTLLGLAGLSAIQYLPSSGTPTLIDRSTASWTQDRTPNLSFAYSAALQSFGDPVMEWDSFEHLRPPEALANASSTQSLTTEPPDRRVPPHPTRAGAAGEWRLEWDSYPTYAGTAAIRPPHKSNDGNADVAARHQRQQQRAIGAASGQGQRYQTGHDYGSRPQSLHQSAIETTPVTPPPPYAVPRGRRWSQPVLAEVQYWV